MGSARCKNKPTSHRAGGTAIEYYELQGDRWRLGAVSIVHEQLTAIRATIMIEVRRGSREGVQTFRTALRRVFVGFEGLLPRDVPHGNRTGRYVRRRVARGRPVVAHPHLRPEALDIEAEGFPALKRASLAGLRVIDSPTLDRMELPLVRWCPVG